MPGPARASGWTPLLIGALGVAAGFLTFAYLSWVQVAGRVSWLGVAMVAVNLGIAVVAVATVARGDRAGRYAGPARRRGWLALGGVVLLGVALYPFMGTIA